MKEYQNWKVYSSNDVQFHMSPDKQGGMRVIATVGPNKKELCIITPECITQWPKCTADGNYGTTYGPKEPSEEKKTKFTLDLTSKPITGAENSQFTEFLAFITAIEDKLLDFVTENQDKLIKKVGKLSREQVKMLQNRSVKEKADAMTGTVDYKVIDLKRNKYTYESFGYQAQNSITICDGEGALIEGGMVRSGDVIACTMWPSSVYTGLAGDKFGITWAFDAVSIICQGSKVAQSPQVSAFAGQAKSAYYAPYEVPVDA